jgi:hypothetical protein
VLSAVLLWPVRGPALVTGSLNLASGPGAALNAGFAGMLACGAVCLVALALRFRRSRGTERQQLKWLLLASALTAPVAIISEEPALERLHLLLLPLVASVPVAAGIAILRHHLLDIDRVITRTIGYGLVTAVLGFGYAGIVLLAGQAFGGITGDPPAWAVAAATLAGAALFRPVHRRTQAAVDRRFDRRGYDASRTVTAFSGRLRNQIDLDTLSAELLTVVDTTMQPSSAGIWLKPPPVGAAQGGRGLG